jgi:hypothetical protein
MLALPLAGLAVVLVLALVLQVLGKQACCHQGSAAAAAWRASLDGSLPC